MSCIINASTSTGLVESADLSGSLQFQTNSGTTAMTIDTSQNVGIGTGATLENKLQVIGSTPSFALTDTAATGNNGNVYLKAYKPGIGWNQLNIGSHICTWSQDGGAEVMRIDSSGNLLVGTTSATIDGFPARFLTVADANTTWAAGFNNTAGGTGSIGFITFTRNGTRTGTISNTGSATAYNTSSDYRLKENIQPMQGALAVVQQLNPVTYTWKADGSDGQGFIAHELQAVVPDCVTGQKDAVDDEGKPVYQGIDTSFLVATLTAAIQELNAKVEALEAKLGVQA